MATVILNRDECAEGFLPHICIRCGETATIVKNQTFKWFPPLLFILLFICLPLYLIFGILMTKQMRVAVPLCDAHRYIFLRRQIVMALGVTSMIAGVLLGIIFGRDFDLQYRWSGGFMIFIGFGFVCGIIVILLGNLLSIFPSRMTKNSISLYGVSPVFVQTVEQVRILLEDEDD